MFSGVVRAGRQVCGEAQAQSHCGSRTYSESCADSMSGCWSTCQRSGEASCGLSVSREYAREHLCDIGILMMMIVIIWIVYTGNIL